MQGHRRPGAGVPGCPDAWAPEDLRIALKIAQDIKVLPCVATDKETVKNVLLELLYSILEEMGEDIEE